MKNFIIGSYVNESGQHYSTVVVIAEDLAAARTKANALELENDHFRADDVFQFITNEFLDSMQAVTDNIWNQVDIVTAHTLEEVDELWNNYPQATEGKCPHCENAYYNSKTIAAGKETFVGAPDPHVVFKEISSCNNCNSLFANWNGY